MKKTERLASQKRVTTRSIAAMKQEGIKIACLTAYDFLMAKLLDQSGVDIILVGDSLGMVFQGQETTLPVTLDEMVYHSKAVMRGVKRSMVVVDMPFMSYQANAEEGFRNAGRVMKETGAGGVKVEGGAGIADFVSMTTGAGIPVMGHLGLTPQMIHQFGGYQPRGTSGPEASKIMKDAAAIQEAGAFALVLEKVPARLAAKVTRSLRIPTIGIGAGPFCDGQVLVVSDMIGMNEEFRPRFVRRYGKLAEEIRSAVGRYIGDIKDGKFPSRDESY